MMGDPINKHLVKDSAYFDPEAMARCLHPNLRKFTFATGETLKLCPDCGYRDDQGCLRRTSRGGD